MMAVPSGVTLTAECGIIYCAIRQKYAREAALSAQSVRKYLPGLPIVLFTDAPPDDADAFDQVVVLSQLSSRPHLDKLVAMQRSPFRQTLFLDTDTFLCGAPIELFELLGSFDVAMTLDRGYYESFPADTGVPAAFCEFNQGVVVYRQSEELQAVLQEALDWADDFHRRTGAPTVDQVPMRIALYRSQLRIATLPLEYNCRFHSFGYLNGPVKILHGRIPGARHTAKNLEKIAWKLNRRTIPRVFVAGRISWLGRLYMNGAEHFFGWGSGSLFRPRYAIAKYVVERCTRALLPSRVKEALRRCLAKR